MTVSPYCIKFEQEFRRKLFTSKEKQKFYTEFMLDGLLRGDMQSRYTAYAVGRNNGWLSANDIRTAENMNPIDGGDVYMVPVNMMPASQSEKFWESKQVKGGEIIAKKTNS